MKSNDFNHKSLSSKVFEYLKEEIFLGNYKSGDRILESKIAEELNISRAPVREAIKELESQGLVINIPRKVSFVVEFSREEIKELFDIRVLLENRVIKILIDNFILNNHDYHELELIVDKMVAIYNDKELDKKEKIIGMNKQDFAFHSYLWKKSSSSKYTVKILTSLYYQLKLAMFRDFKSEDNLFTSAKKHYNIIKYLKKRDITQTKKVLIDHIVSYNESLLTDLID